MNNEDMILLIGMGLMGGSFYKCLTKLGYDIICIDTNEMVVDNVLACDSSIKFITYDEVDQFNFKYTIATCYPDNVIQVFNALNDRLNSDCIVLEMTGLKGNFINDLKDYQFNFKYVLCHPMAGLEKYGFKYSIAELFKDANFCYITDVIQVDVVDLNGVELFVESMGFKSFVGCSGSVHDQAITYVSHLPHVLAMMFLNSELLTPIAMEVAATSFADVTRVGNVDIDLWKRLLYANHENINLQLNQIIEECNKLKEVINDETMLESYMQSAKVKHQQIYK